MKGGIKMGWNCDAHRAEHNACGHQKLNHPPHSHCTFDIWAPDKHSSMNNLAFSAYAHHQQLMDDFIEVLAASDDPNDVYNQYEAARCVGLDINSLTMEDIQYMEREVAKRI